MSDQNTDGPDKDAPSSKASADGRRQVDRRQSQQPFEGPDRRKGDRRSGTDRRTAPRAEGLSDEEE